MNQPTEELEIALHGFLPVSTVNGPGKRSVVWVQGCIFDCPGCFNQEARPFTRDRLVTGSELIAQIPSEVEGITISGGEPFCQAWALIGFCREVKARGLTIMLYSGYTLARIKAIYDPACLGLLEQADILVDGLYEQKIPATNPWAGSGNQQVHFLSTRYSAILLPVDQKKQARYEEIIIDEEGLVIHTGF